MCDEIPAPDGVSSVIVEGDDGELMLIGFSIPEPVIPDGLSPSEVEVAKLLLADMKPEAIAVARDSSVNTVRNQIRSIHAKLGVANTAEFARLCSAKPSR